MKKDQFREKCICLYLSLSVSLSLFLSPLSEIECSPFDSRHFLMMHAGFREPIPTPLRSLGGPTDRGLTAA